MKSKLIETMLSTAKVFSGKYLAVWRDDVRMPDGRNSIREYIKHPGAALIIPVLPNGHFVMVYQFRYSVGEIFLEFPAGKCDPGEKAHETAARELREEVGYSSENITYLTHIHPVIGYSNERIDIFLAENLKPAECHLDADEFLEVVEISPEDLRRKIWNSEITDVKTQIAAQWYFKKMGLEL